MTLLVKCPLHITPHPLRNCTDFTTYLSLLRALKLNTANHVIISYTF